MKLSASILDADFMRLGEEVQAVIEAGADEIHLDVMDNHFVPNLSFGPLVAKALRGAGIETTLDVHLMTQPVTELIHAFAATEVNRIGFHPEASEFVMTDLMNIKSYASHGIQTCLVLNPTTELATIQPEWVAQLDRILLMSVTPGFGRQSFMPKTLDKIATLKERIKQWHQEGMIAKPIEIAVDGGVKIPLVADLRAAGADVCIMGTGIFGEADYHKVVQDFRHAAGA